MNALVRYEAARTALAECQRVDEVKDIRDKAEAMAAYARQAKDTELIQYATEIKVRAERRAGEMLASMEKHKGGDPKRLSQAETGAHPRTLTEMGIHRNDSHRWQSLAGMSDEHFETAVATAKDTAGQVTTAFMLREAQRHRPTRKTTKRDEQRLQEMQEAKARGVSMLSTYARLTLTALRAASDFNDEERELLSELAAEIEKVSTT